MGGDRWRVVAVVVGMGVLLCARTEARDPNRGWTRMVGKLTADGVDRAWAERVFRDQRVPAFTGLSYGLYPGESRAAYSGLLRQRSVSRARGCKRTHASRFTRAEKAYGVDRNLLAAILYIETRCGGYTGNHRVLYRLARLAMANEPANVNHNINRHSRGATGRGRQEIVARTRERGKYLEDTFYPEVHAAFTIAKRLRIDPLEIRGSGAGAFGLPQFLPTNYLKFGVDADGNGRVSLFDPDDAISSCANYLKGHGWRPGLSRRDKRKVIWNYNHSEPYVDAVLGLTDRLGQ